MTSSENTDLHHVRRGLARQRWTSVITSAGLGTVLVALIARLTPASALATEIFAIVAVAAAVQHAVIEDRRWGRAFSTLRVDCADAARRDPTRRSA